MNWNEFPSIENVIEDGCCIVMTQFGLTLNEYIGRVGKLSQLKVNLFGIQILNMLQKIHSVGYVYNDLKDDNLCLGNMGKIDPDSLKMIDFGLATKYVDDDGHHKEQQFENRDQGNQFFSSHDQMKMLTTSRKDDFISLCYLLVYLLDKTLPFLDENQQKSTYIGILEQKQNLKISEVCQTQDSQKIIGFVTEVFSLGFSE